MVSGTGKEGALELRYVAVNTDIQEGDLLATSGIDGVYPPGLPVAVVSKIERNSAYVFARVTCMPAGGVGYNRQLLILALLTPLLKFRRRSWKSSLRKRSGKKLAFVNYPRQEILLPAKGSFIALSLFVALLLNLLPLKGDGAVVVA